jgi:hypothetical protein
MQGLGSPACKLLSLRARLAKGCFKGFFYAPTKHFAGADVIRIVLFVSYFIIAKFLIFNENFRPDSCFSFCLLRHNQIQTR